MKRMNFRARLATFSDPNSCWLWPGHRDHRDGYATTTYRGVHGFLVHRAAYIELVGPIPENMEIDHLCKVRHCMNPAHLEAVDRATNTWRSTFPSAVNARRDTCVNGHQFDPGNTRTYVKPDGYVRRVCRACDRAKAARYFARKSA